MKENVFTKMGNIVSIPILLALFAIHWLITPMTMPDFQISGVTCYSVFMGIFTVITLRMIYVLGNSIEYDKVVDKKRLWVLKTYVTIMIYVFSYILVETINESASFAISNTSARAGAIGTLIFLIVPIALCAIYPKDTNDVLQRKGERADIEKNDDSFLPFIGILALSLAIPGLLFYSTVWDINAVKRIDSLVTKAVSSKERELFVKNADKIADFKFPISILGEHASSELLEEYKIGLTQVDKTKFRFNEMPIELACSSNKKMNEYECLSLTKDYIELFRIFLKAQLNEDLGGSADREKELQDLRNYFNLK